MRYMMRKPIRYLLFVVIGIPFLLSSCEAGHREKLDLKKADLKQGGLLYDKWWKVSKKTTTGPNETHPLYPPEGKKKGSTTWRCKECHGWDYKGRDGAYKSGSHFTGIKGIFESRTKSAREVYGILRGATNPNHDFSRVLNEDELKSITKFIKDGIVDFGTLIDYSTKAARGDASRGKLLFSGKARCSDCHGSDGRVLDFGKARCSDCHGSDGRVLDFGKPGEPVFIGTLALKNPWEMLHKIRFGHPGSEPEMPSGLVDLKLTDREAVDVLAYAQNLPKK
jgi:mono/diheme cytochrome c family protein